MADQQKGLGERVGNEAHDDPDSGNPSKTGGRARATAIAAVANDDRVDAIYTLTGGALMAGSNGGNPLDLQVNATGQLEAEVQGPISHDGPDSSLRPVKVGAHASVGLRTAVGENDLADLSCDLAGQLRVINEASDPLSVQGDIAHDAADLGNPLSMGLNTAEFNADPPQVNADNDRVRAIATAQGIQWTLGGHPNIIRREWMTTAAQTNDPIVDSIAVGSQIIVTAISVMVSAAGSVNPQVRIGFGAASTPAEPTSGNEVDEMLLSHPGIAPGSGVVEGNGSGAIAVGADGAELRITNSVPTGGQITVLVSYYISSL